MPTRSDWFIFEGVRATRRGADMVIEARRLYKARTGKPGPGISQGGKSGSVGASGGTHLREAFDFRTSHFSSRECMVWEECLWQVGFAAWWRRAIPGLWPPHHHAIPKGGDLSPAAKNQEKAFEWRRDGLRSNRAYPRIGTYAYRTWEQYLKTRPAPPAPPLPKVKISGKYYDDVPYVSLHRVRLAWNSGRRSVEVWWCQKWLDRLGYYKAPRDGIRGHVTWRAWTDFLKANRLKDPGSPNLAALQLLGKKAKTAKKIRRR